MCGKDVIIMSVDFSKMDWRALKKYFDPNDDVDNSPFCYADAVEKLTNHLLKMLAEYEVETAEAIAEIKKLNLPQEFNFSAEEVIQSTRAQIENTRQQAVSLRENLLSTYNLNELAKLENKSRPSFALLTEVIVRRLNLQLNQMEEKISREMDFYNFYWQHKDFVKKFANVLHMRPHRIDYLTALVQLLDYVTKGHLFDELGGNSTAADYVLDQLIDLRNEAEKCAAKITSSWGWGEERQYCAMLLVPLGQFQGNIRKILTKIKNSKDRRWLEDWANSLKIEVP